MVRPTPILPPELQQRVRSYYSFLSEHFAVGAKMDMHLQASGSAADLDEDDHKALVFTLGKIGKDEWFGLPETDGPCSTDDVYVRNAPPPV